MSQQGNEQTVRIRNKLQSGTSRQEAEEKAGLLTVGSTLNDLVKDALVIDKTMALSNLRIVLLPVVVVPRYVELFGCSDLIIFGSSTRCDCPWVCSGPLSHVVKIMHTGFRKVLNESFLSVGHLHFDSSQSLTHNYCP